MAAWLRPNQKLAKVVYALLQTPKQLQQKNDPQPSAKRLSSWKIDTSTNS